MTVLITGISGFVGKYLSECLFAGGEKDIYGSDILLREEHVEEHNYFWRQLDITDSQAVMRLLDEIRPKKVYHLAAIAATNIADSRPYYNVNFVGTLNLLEAVRQVIPGCRVLYVSSSNIYGQVPEQLQPIREEQPLQPVNHYAASKTATDLAARTYALNGLQVILARPFNHTGPGQNTDFVCSRLAKIMAEIKLGRQEPVIEAGNVDAARDFTDVRDIVKAYRLLMQKGKPGEAYNICSGQVYSIREIIGMLAGWAGVEVKIKTRADLLRSVDIDIVRGSKEKITAATGWEPLFDFRETLRDLLLYWEKKLIA